MIYSVIYTLKSEDCSKTHICNLYAVSPSFALEKFKNNVNKEDVKDLTIVLSELDSLEEDDYITAT